MRATRAIVHLENLAYNLANIAGLLPDRTSVCVPVKADAYGHGALPVSRAALSLGASHLAVATVGEGIELRAAGIEAPILLLGIPHPDELGELATAALEAFVTDAEYAESLARAARKAGVTARVHLKIDSGMGRIGCSCEEAAALAGIVSETEGLALAGVATHLPVADSRADGDMAYTERQIGRFLGAVESVRKAGIDPGIVHAANSGGILQHPSSHLDMVRPGIISYGYLPDPALAGFIDLKPVMELETAIAAIRSVKAGTSVSYGRTWTAERDTVIATIPVGYGDGLPRRASPGLTVGIGGTAYPVVGRICMDQCMVDLGPGSAVRRWDRVTVFGPAPAPNSAADVASFAGTIPYEITCNVNKRVPRVYVGIK